MKRAARAGVAAVASGWLVAAVPAAVVEIPLVPASRFAEEASVPPGGPQITRQGDDVEAVLSNGCMVRLDAATGAVRATTPAGVVLLATDPGPILGLRFLPPGLGPEVQPSKPAVSFRFKELASFGEAVLFRFEFSGDDGVEGGLEWSFLPVRRRIAGEFCDGVADAFSITVAARMLHEVSFAGLAAPGPDFAGARTIRLACFGPQAGAADVSFGGQRHDLGWWGAGIDGGQLFQVVGQRQGTVCEWLDDECHDMTNIRSNGRNDAVEIRHVILVGRVPGLWQSPRRMRMFTPEPLGPQLWMDLARGRRATLARAYDVPATPRRPMLVARNFWHKTPFDAFAADTLPRIRDLGWRRIEIGWAYRRGLAPATGHAWPTSAVYDAAGRAIGFPPLQCEEKDVLLETQGGEAALAAFVGRAHALGIEVYLWHQTAHGWRGSSDVRNHPDWIIHDPTGKPIGGNHPESLVFYDLRSGFRAATLERIRGIRERTGVDGLWLDLYGAGLHRTPNYIHTVAAPTAAERMAYLRDLRRLGLGLYGEGVTSTVIDSFILWKEPNWQGREFILHDTSPFVMDPAAFADLDLFLLASYRCFPTDGPDLLATAETEAERERLAAVVHRNRCIAAVEDTLGEPLGLVIQPAGTQWVHERGHALFFAAAAEIAVPLPREPGAVRAIGPDGDLPVTVAGTTLIARLPARSLLMITWP